MLCFTTEFAVHCRDAVTSSSTPQVGLCPFALAAGWLVAACSLLLAAWSMLAAAAVVMVAAAIVVMLCVCWQQLLLLGVCWQLHAMKSDIQCVPI